MSVIFMFSSINQAKTHKYEFKHFIYENKQGFDGITQTKKQYFIEFDEHV